MTDILEELNGLFKRVTEDRPNWAVVAFAIDEIRALRARVARFDQLVSGPLAYADKSHIEIAGMVRMLGRNDLNHEAVCTAARDRIAWLADELGKARADYDAVSALQKAMEGKLNDYIAHTKRAEARAADRDDIVAQRDRLNGECAELEAQRDAARTALVEHCITARHYPVDDSDPGLRLWHCIMCEQEDLEAHLIEHKPECPLHDLSPSRREKTEAA